MPTLVQRGFGIAVAILMVAVPLRAQRRSNILTADEIEQANLTASNAYEVVEMLRPRWLAKREPLGRLPIAKGEYVPPPDEESLRNVSIRVWVNGQNTGYGDYLKTIPLERIQEMRWYSANEAGSRFGSSEGEAVIEVTLQR